MDTLHVPAAPTKRRKRSSGVLRESDLDAAVAVTFDEVEYTDKHGKIQTKKVKVSLDPITASAPSNSFSAPAATTSQTIDLDNGYDFTFDKQPRTRKTEADYLHQYINGIGDLLQALLSSEALHESSKKCKNCVAGNWAIWKCKDCIQGAVMCRHCMRATHERDPLHRIQKWTGDFFRPADLWEVGSYLVVPHRDNEPLCEALKTQVEYFRQAEEAKDAAEQTLLHQLHARTAHSPEPQQTQDVDMDDGDDSLEAYMQATAAEGGCPTPADEEALVSQYLDEVEHLAGGRDPLLEEDIDNDEAADDDDDIEEELPRTAQYLPPARPLPTSADERLPAPVEFGQGGYLGHTYIRIVHTNGVHHLGMICCPICNGEHDSRFDMVAAGFLPTSFVRLQTLFSHQVLDSFRLSNLELKASAYQFYQLLRRRSRPMAPAAVVDLYRQLRRLARIWRWMKKLKWAGYGINGQDPLQVGPGELSIYCPACPQPGINLPDDWKDDIERWVYKRIFVADGNFKADHVRQKNAAADVWLSDGGGMMPKQEEYRQFLKSAIEKQTKAPCENTFRAIMNALLASKSCDRTGIFACACGRHGCYAPNSLVDLFKGEQQKNADFSFLQALKTTGVDPEQGVLLIYDIACQYIIHLYERIGGQLPEGLEVDAAIGLFHVHAHKDECFFRFATSFIPQAAIVAGEILESLWSALNSVSPMVRTATHATRAEMLDEHACDSNHKKCLGMAATLQTHHAAAADMVDYADNYLKNLADGVPDLVLLKWKEDIEEVEKKRLADRRAMDIYAAQGMADAATSSPQAAALQTALDRWLDFALTVEEKQFTIQAREKELSRSSDGADTLESARNELLSLMSKLTELQVEAGVTETQSSKTSTAVGDEDDIWDAALLEEPTDGSEQTSTSVPSVAQMAAEALSVQEASGQVGGHRIPLEKQLLVMPSNGNVAADHRALELSFRRQRAAHHLNRVRDLIAEKSFQYSHVIRAAEAPRKGVRTRSRAVILKLNAQLAYHCRLYSRCRSRMITLGADQQTLNVFRALLSADVKASTALIKPNARGSTTLTLSWIWRSADGPRFGLSAEVDGPPNDAPNLLECELHISWIPHTPNFSKVKRVHWLRARAKAMRWREEYMLVAYEMQWTVRFFLHKQNKWAEAIMGAVDAKSGPRAYAIRQREMWHHMALMADRSFKLTATNYKSPL